MMSRPTISTILAFLLISLSVDAKPNASFNEENIDQSLFNFAQSTEPGFWDADCPLDSPLSELGGECHPLKVFNRTELEDWDEEEPLKRRRVAKRCACELLRMTPLWLKSFNTLNLQRLAKIVLKTLEQQNFTYRPPYLWSDMDVAVRGVSIWTATSDYFAKQLSPQTALRPEERRRVSGNEIWRLVRGVCAKIAADRHGLYRYLENLNRLDPVVFIGLPSQSPIIEEVYAASKACKLLLQHNLGFYRLQALNPDLVAVQLNQESANQTQHSSLPPPSDDNYEDQNHIDDYEDDRLKLSSSSVLLLHCDERHLPPIQNIQELERECPIMTNEEAPRAWLLQHQPDSRQRSEYALNCGCQLLKHQRAWQQMLADKNVDLMQRALTGYLNRNLPYKPNEQPVWSLHGWFEATMGQLTSNRKRIIKELQMARDNTRDLTASFKLIQNEALELLRRGCNYIMFNYNKGRKEAQVELRLIRYLDNLQQISPDQLFVFNLALQDPNLFKLYALAKMCQPIVY